MILAPATVVGFAPGAQAVTADPIAPSPGHGRLWDKVTGQSLTVTGLDLSATAGWTAADVALPDSDDVGYRSVEHRGRLLEPVVGPPGVPGTRPGNARSTGHVNGGLFTG